MENSDTKGPPIMKTPKKKLIPAALAAFTLCLGARAANEDKTWDGRRSQDRRTLVPRLRPCHRHQHLQHGGIQDRKDWLRFGEIILV